MIYEKKLLKNTFRVKKKSGHQVLFMIQSFKINKKIS